jgi:hypothetical protein
VVFFVVKNSVNVMNWAFGLRARKYLEKGGVDVEGRGATIEVINVEGEH